MSLFGKLFSKETGRKVDYYEEGVALLRSGQHHEALTSLRLALREDPQDVATLQQIAVAYTHIGMSDEAIKTHRTVLRKDESAAAARYGLAFLLLRAGQEEEAAGLLEAFLRAPPDGPDAARHVAHARETLGNLRGDTPADETVQVEHERAEAWPSP
jgi:predicted Zn-dependent protease